MISVVNCPLCCSDDCSAVEELRVADIDRLYRSKCKVSALEEFRGQESVFLESCDKCGLFFFHPLFAGSERFYETLRKFDWYYLDKKPEYEFAKRYISAGDKVLEVGCGKGAFLKELPANGTTGIEFNPSAATAARAAGLNALGESVQAHSEKNAGAYDVVCAFQVLEHVPDPREFLASCVACLKPTGRLIICVPSLDSYTDWLVNYPLNKPPHHLTLWPDVTLERLAGLLDLRVATIWHEPLWQGEEATFAKTMLIRAFYRLLGRRWRRIDLSMTKKCLTAAAVGIGKLLGPEFGGEKCAPRGMSVVAVYEKARPA